MAAKASIRGEMQEYEIAASRLLGISEFQRERWGDLTNDAQVSEDGVDLAPFHIRQLREAVVHLARRLVEKFAQDMVQ